MEERERELQFSSTGGKGKELWPEGEKGRGKRKYLSAREERKKEKEKNGPLLKGEKGDSGKQCENRFSGK